MNTFTSAICLLVASTAIGVNAQGRSPTIGFGPPTGEIYMIANQNPLNRTSITFPGFNFSVSPASTSNVTSTQQWTWNAGLSIVDMETNRTNYPISAAANTTSNVIDIAYTLDIPGGQLPEQNDTNWTVCTNIFSVPWTDAVLGRAAGDPGDCSVALGAACLNRIQQEWRGRARLNTGCPQPPDFTSYSECGSISTNGYTIGSSSIMSFFSDPNNRNSTRVGLKSGQIFSYQSSGYFNASQAQSTYTDYASNLRMVALTFTPSQAFVANHSGTLNAGEVRTFCSVLNKSSPRSNAAPKLSPYSIVGVSTAVWTLLFTCGIM